jgi:hypothetical protein
MPVTCDCPACSRRLLVPDDVWQNQVSCPTCHTVFVPAERLPAPEPTPAARPVPEVPQEKVRADQPPPRPDAKEAGAAADTDFSPRPLPHAEEDYQPLRESGPLPGGVKGTVAMVMLAVCAAFHLIAGVIQFAYVQMQEGPDGGRLGPGEAQAFVDALTLLSFLDLALRMTTAIPFWIWFYQAYRNLNLMRVSGLSYSPGWAVGGFIVPILQLFRPYQVAQETWKASDPGETPENRYAWRNRAGSSIVGGWWACWLGMNFAAILTPFAEGRTGNEPGDTLGTVLHHALAVPAALLALLMIKQIRERQSQKWDRLALG